MRDHGNIAPAFWSSPTGRKMRKNKDARILATYLFTGSNANMIGLYYLPWPLAVYETGLTDEEATAALAWLEAEGVAYYDRERELVFIPEMARFQLDDELEQGDNRAVGVLTQLEAYKGHRFAQTFWWRYKEPFRLLTAGKKGLGQKLEEHFNRIAQRDEKGSEPAAEPLRRGPIAVEDPSEAKTGTGTGTGTGGGIPRVRAETPVPPPPASPEPPPSAPDRPSGYELQKRFGLIRADVLGGLPWKVPPDRNGEASTFAESLQPDEIADVATTMRLALELIRDGADGWAEPRLRQSVPFAFAAWRQGFTELRERLHRKQPAAPPARASPGQGPPARPPLSYLP